MADNVQTSAPKSYILSFEYRRTGMGGFDDTIIMSMTGEIIRSILRTSRSGNHGTRIYKILPAKYLLYSVTRSNGGNLYAKIRLIEVNDDGNISVIRDWQMDSVEGELLRLDEFPQEIREILVANKDSLPLYQYIFPFDEPAQF